jgi:hypothetical protein
MDVQKFNWAESFNSSNGQSSISLVAAFIMIVGATLVFVWSAFTKYNDGLTNSILYATLGAGLLGIRRFTKDKDTVDMTSDAAQTVTATSIVSKTATVSTTTEPIKSE